jgi:hypothetical protein
VIQPPEPTDPEPGHPAPEVGQYRLLIDLRERFEPYLEHAAAAWLDRNVPAPGLSPGERDVELADYDEDGLTVTYYRDYPDYQDQRRSTQHIPIADVLPDYARAQAFVDTLTRGVPVAAPAPHA